LFTHIQLWVAHDKKWIKCENHLATFYWMLKVDKYVTCLNQFIMLKYGMYDCIPKPKMVVKLTFVTYIKYVMPSMLIGDLIYLT